MAEEEAKRKQEGIYRKAKENGSVRKSKRLLSQSLNPRIKTDNMRRLYDLFWADEDDDESSGESGSSSESDTGSGNSTSCSSEANNHANDNDDKMNHEKGKEEDNFIKVSPRLRLKRIHCSPNIYTIDNFVTEVELNFLQNKIDFANKKKLFEKSFIDDASSATSDTCAKAKKGRKPSRKRQRSCIEKHENEMKKKNDNNNSTDADTFKDSDGMSAGNSSTRNTDTLPTCNQNDSSSVNNDSADDVDNCNDEATTNDDTFKQRTSQFIHFTKRSNAIITSIEQRACELLSLPNESIEPLQLVKYDIGQYFAVHHDLGILYDDGSVELPLRSNVLLSPPRRIVTILVYLNDVDPCHGGSTQFPLLENECNGEQKMKMDVNTEVKKEDHRNGKNGCDNSDVNEEKRPCLEIYPKRGMALIWCNISKDGLPDTRVVHSGQPLVNHSISSTTCEKKIMKHQKVDRNINNKEAASIDELNKYNSHNHHESPTIILDCKKEEKTSSEVIPPIVKYAMNIWACEY